MRAGAVLVVEQDGALRRAVVLEVRGPNGGPPFLVRWSDSRRTGLLVPDSDTRVVAQAPAPRAPLPDTCVGRGATGAPGRRRAGRRPGDP